MKGENKWMIGKQEENYGKGKNVERKMEGGKREGKMTKKDKEKRVDIKTITKRTRRGRKER